MRIFITSAENGKTVKQYLAREKFSARLITKLKSKERGILVNGERCTVRRVLYTGDILELETEDSQPSRGITLSYLPIDIIYEDEWYIAVSKPPHLPVHPSRRHTDDTLASRVMAHFENKNFVFRPLTRLDLDTSGAVLIAKDPISASRFCEMLVKREIKKEYIAICDGIFDRKEGVIDYNIRRVQEFKMEREAVDKGVGRGESSPEGMEAVTEYKVISEGRGASLVQFFPITGRTHQLRVHAMAIGHPIIGDTLYSSPSEYIDRQALHAASLEFIHPMTGKKVKITCDASDDFKICQKELFNV